MQSAISSCPFASLAIQLLVVWKVVSAGETLKLTQVLFRHGDRSAVDTYPTDKYGEGIWPQGFGQLSMIGMRQHYSLGQFFKERYINETGLLNRNYTKNQIYIRSTDYERTLMSAESDLAGMFAPGSDQQWNDGVGKVWQPIPVHTRVQDRDQLLTVHRDTCPRYLQLEAEQASTHPYAKFEAQYKDLMAMLSTKSGLSNTFLNITNLFDMFFCQKQHFEDKYWPRWMNETILSTLKLFLDERTRVEHAVPEMCKLAGGPIVGVMIKNMRTSIEDPENLIKMYMYSAHDMTVAALLSALRVLDPPVNPPYIACVMVELYQRDNNQYFVRVFYRNDSTPHPLKIPGCSSLDCEFNEFVKATSAMTVDDLEKACKTYFAPSGLSVAITVASVTLASILMFSLSCCYLRRKRKQRYQNYLITEQNYEEEEEEDDAQAEEME